jgi:hypothetical protein
MSSTARRVEWVNGQVMACFPTNKATEPNTRGPRRAALARGGGNSILIRIDRNDRPALLAESPDLDYAPDHDLGYDGVLVRLQHLTPAILHDLLAMAHKFATRKPSAQRRK